MMKVIPETRRDH